MSRSSKSPHKGTTSSSKKPAKKRIDKRSAVEGELIPDTPAASASTEAPNVAKTSGESNTDATTAANSAGAAGDKTAVRETENASVKPSPRQESSKESPKAEIKPEATPQTIAKTEADSTDKKTASKPNDEKAAADKLNTKTDSAASKAASNTANESDKTADQRVEKAANKMTDETNSSQTGAKQTATPNDDGKLPMFATILGVLALALGVYNWYQSSVTGLQTMGSQQSRLASLSEKVDGIDSSQTTIGQAFEQNKSLLSQEFEQSKTSLSQQLEQTKSSLAQQITQSKDSFAQQLEQTKTGLGKQISDNQTVVATQLDEVKNRVADIQQGMGAQLLDTKATLNTQVSTLEKQVLSGRGKLDLLISEAGHALDDKVESAHKQAREQAAKFRTEYSSLATALGAMNKDFNASKQSLALSEVGNLLTLADQRLRLGGDTVVASEALKLADTQLAKQQNDDFIELREAINNDVNTLAAAPKVDVSGMVLRLNALSGAVSEWPLQADKESGAPAPQAEAETQAPQDDGGFLSLGKQLMSQMVEVRAVDAATKPSLAPQERYFLAENFRLKLQAAQLGVLKEQQDAYSENIKAAAAWLQTHFDAENASVADAIGQLNGMAETSVTAERPAVNASLQAFASLTSDQ